MFVRYFKYIFGADGTDIAAENFDKGGSGELVVCAFDCMCQSCIQPWHWRPPGPGAGTYDSEVVAADSTQVQLDLSTERRR